MTNVIRFTESLLGGYTLFLITTGLLIGNIDLHHNIWFNFACLIGSVVTFFTAMYYYSKTKEFSKE